MAGIHFPVDPRGSPQNNIQEIPEDDSSSDDSISDYLSSHDEEEDNMSDVASVHDALDHRGWCLESIEEFLNAGDSSSINLVVDFQTPLERVVKHRNCSAPLIRLLLHYGADPNHSTFTSFSSIYYALYYSHLHSSSEIDRIEVIKALVEGGARAGQSSLSFAISMRFGWDIIQLVVSAGADLFRMNEMERRSPILSAFQVYDLDSFKHLVDLQDFDINLARDELNGSLLHTVLRRNACGVNFVNFFIDRGVSVNSVDKYGNTPLHTVVLNACKLDVVDALLKRGALVCCRNGDGNTALEYVLLRSDRDSLSDVIQLVLKYFFIEYPNHDIERISNLVGDFYAYANDCKLELLKMTFEKFGNGYNLLEFLQMYSGNQVNGTEENGFNVDQLLNIVSNNIYPLYTDVIASKLGGTILKDKLNETSIRSVNCNKRKRSEMLV